MCGIAAIFNYATGEPVDRAEMGRMLAHMQLRGPDGSGEWYGRQGAIGLGHRRLSIIDLSEAGAQPMVSDDGRYVITFNGEIYNYRELRAELERKGCRFRSQSDTEVVLQLYRLEGEAMLPKLRGMFAFAIWDDTRQGLFLARDPLGIKPLYYADDGRTLRVASQVKTLLAGGGVDTAPEPAGHVGFFLWGHIPAPFTLYRGIRNHSAGTSQWVERGGTKTEKTFFTVAGLFTDAEGQVADSRPPSSDLLGSSLRDSVRHHLIADVPVGIFLSSGLDSCTLAALAAENTASLHTVTLGFTEYQGTANDEVPLAEQVARQYGTKHRTVWVSKQDFRDQFAGVLNAMDQPSCDGVNSYFVSLAAARTGLKVVLSGVGGDELFGGYPSFQEIPRAVSVLRPFRFCRPLGAGLRLVSAPFLQRMTSPKYAGLLEYGGTYGGAYLLRRGMFMPWELPVLLDPDLARAGWNELQIIARLDETVSAIQSPHLKVSALEMSWYMRQQLLRDTDWASMAHSVEVRTPLVDVELVRSLAPLFATNQGPTKRDMALTPHSPLPGSVLNRPKTGFSVPVRQWLMDENTQPVERGLRGWTRLIYSAFVSNQSGSLDTTHAAMRQSQPKQRPKPRRILVFRIGQLGDTVVALPAMWAVRQQFPDAEITLLCDRHPGRNYVLGADLLRGSRLFQKFEFYPASDEASNLFLRSRDLLQLLDRLRQGHYDMLVYLSPTLRSPSQIKRDRRFFRVAGIQQVIGMNGFTEVPKKLPGQPLGATASESDLLLTRLAADGITVPRPGMGCMDLNLGVSEEAAVSSWLDQLPDDGGRTWIAFGPGSKMPAKRWPLERFAEVGKALIERYDIWPVVFGGSEDRDVAEDLLNQWGRGYSAAGRLPLRGAAQALKSCAFYVGNDTGTMHLAATAGIRCVAIFSAREWSGMWFPYGSNHHVLRSKIECEGCGLEKCVERKNECLQRITADQVLAECHLVMAQKLNC